MKKLGYVAVAALALMSLLVGGCGSDKKADTASGNKLIVYTSMKENLIRGIVDGFKKANPGIEVDYQSAGAGKLMAKIAAERQSGKILADVIWTSEVPDFYKMKMDGILENYKSPVYKECVNPFDDYDGSFHAARLGTLGIIVNTDKIKNAPTQWSDLLKPEYKNKFGIANPALSGTSYMSVALLAKQFGWDYFYKLKANGARIGKGSGQVIDDTASGELYASLAVDYITHGKIEKGAHIKMCYPPELLVVPSPVAIFKDSTKKDAAKKFVDYLLGKEAQTQVAKQGTIPVREDVALPNKHFDLLKPVLAWKKAMKVNFTEAVKTKENTIKKFTEILQVKK
ncbi:MAG: ABC transporter substrate-binding protein [Phascolarctobacterium sp.]|nr:ABC transporter substrate-binding protein [Candidatus Phascolarctobacterium caballi]MCQ2381325.1 ABC transporter substrate-binding protein [Acidaminococcaceae bacterium]